MATPSLPGNVLRIGVFYDGSYFQHVSDFYFFSHWRHARLSLQGMQEFIRQLVAQSTARPLSEARIVEAHYFRGRRSAREAVARDALLAERHWDDHLMHLGITSHYLPLVTGSNDRFVEKGVDVLFTVEALERAMSNRFDVLVMVAGDGDFAPLARCLQRHGIPVALLAWDLGQGTESRTGRGTRTSRRLMAESMYVHPMHQIIDDPARADDPSINALFRVRPEQRTPTAGEALEDGIFPSVTADAGVVVGPLITPGAVEAIEDPDLTDAPVASASADTAESGETVQTGEFASPYAEELDDASGDRADDIEAGGEDVGSVIEGSGSIFRMKDTYGFIAAPAFSRHVFFHRSALVGVDPLELRAGDAVEFSGTVTDRGPIAQRVQRVGARTGKTPPVRRALATPPRMRAVGSVAADDDFEGGYPL